jgi:hypothetical protein
MKVRFRNLTREALAPRALLPQTPVAVFEVEGGLEGTVLAGHVSPFTDLDLLVWSGRPRENVLLALCAEVQHADWEDAGAHRLALHRRFTLEPDRDEPVWKSIGFTSIQNVDLHIIKHVLGVGETSPQSELRWSRLLGIDLQRKTLLGQLEQLGCVDWKRLITDPDPGIERPIGLYHNLSRSVRASCIRLLAPLRERYMKLAFEAILATAHIQKARHVHLGTEHDSVMHFLDGAGTTVIVKGERSSLVTSTAFSALADGEMELGPATLRKRWVRILHDVNALSGDIRVHSPLTWRMTT